MTALLELDAVTVRFGGVTAVDDLSFRLNRGELLGLIGPNGAGKTTVMRAITGVVKPQRGSIVLAGRPLDGLPPHRRVRLGLGLSQQIVRPFANMSALDNVALAAGLAKTRQPLAALFRLSRRRERARARELLALVGIADAAAADPLTLALGYRKRLEMARALALDPAVLLLDEPLAGLNQSEATRLADTIADLHRRGQTIVLIEHNLSEVMRICPRLLVQDNGRRIADGETRTVMADPAVQEAYLGKRRDA